MQMADVSWKSLGLLILVVALSPMSGGASGQADSPRVAYVTQGTLYVVTASGKLLETAKPETAIEDFAISSDASQVAFPVRGKNRYGGQIYLLAVSSGHLTRLTAGLRPEVQLGSGEREVYDEPDFSPDGNQILFDVHYENAGDANDLVMASGPLAVMNLKTRHTRILQATKNIDGHGPAFTNNPSWSPNGEKILVDFEAGAAVLGPDGAGLIDLSDEMIQDRGEVLPGGFSWLGNACVVYFLDEENRTGPDFAHKEVRILHLKTRTSEPAARLLGVPSEMLIKADGLEVSGDLTLIRTKSESLVFDALRAKVIQRLQTPYARLVGGGRVDPGHCD